VGDSRATVKRTARGGLDKWYIAQDDEGLQVFEKRLPPPRLEELYTMANRSVCRSSGPTHFDSTSNGRLTNIHAGLAIYHDYLVRLT
jgi:hypothetical protein